MKVLYFLVSILALASSIAFAYDPSPLQDFCVAIQDPKDGGMDILIPHKFYSNLVFCFLFSLLMLIFLLTFKITTIFL
jgi:hypothetical protein